MHPRAWLSIGKRVTDLKGFLCSRFGTPGPTPRRKLNVSLGLASLCLETHSQQIARKALACHMSRTTEHPGWWRESINYVGISLEQEHCQPQFRPVVQLAMASPGPCQKVRRRSSKLCSCVIAAVLPAPRLFDLCPGAHVWTSFQPNMMYGVKRKLMGM